MAGLVAAWNASTLTNAALATAVDADPDIVITVDSGSAGIPMTVTLAASGTGAITKVSTTANKGPNDYNTVENWTLGAVPVADTDVRISGTVDILYGLDQSGTEIDDFIVENYSGTIGGTDGAYLQISMGDNVFSYRSSGRGYIDLGASAVTTIAPIVHATGSAPTLGYSLALKATGAAVWVFNGGHIGFGIEADDTTSECTTFNTTNTNLTIGRSVKNRSAADITTVNQTAGTLKSYSNIATLNLTDNGVARIEQGGIISTTANVFSGIIRPNGSGVYVAAVIYPDGQLVNDEDSQAKTFTNLAVHPGATVKDPQGQITFTNPWTWPAGVNI